MARLAEISGPGKHLMAAVDGIKQKHGTGEWVGDSPNHWWGEIVYPAIKVTWKSPQKVNKVVVYDRPSLEAHMAAAVLKFSDGSEEHVFAWHLPPYSRPDAGRCLESGARTQPVPFVVRGQELVLSP